jgi:hypothetical protein
MSNYIDCGVCHDTRTVAEFLGNPSNPYPTGHVERCAACGECYSCGEWLDEPALWVEIPSRWGADLRAHCRDCARRHENALESADQ